VSSEAHAFEAVVADLDGPTYVVTTAAGAERDGCLVGFALQCSIQPPRFAVWLSKENRTYRIALSAATLVVHLLRQGDQDLAHLFGGETGDEVDKLEDVEWRPGPDGCPVLARCDWFAGSIIDRVDTGDHLLFVLTPTGGECKRSDTSPLGMREIGDIEAGHPVSES
jgi:flavin reductase (DIM6/NTAB) family NADH-FMN oxidoreductase RutF